MAEQPPHVRLRRRLGRLVAKPSEAAGAPAPRTNGRKRKTPGKMLRAKPPNVRGRGPLLDGPGLTVAIVAMVKDEAEYLEEWLAYHHALGVDHFFLYDNGSTDGSAELLRRYINHGLVTRIDWPIGGGQLAANNHALRLFGATTEWLGFYDPDEFLVPLLDDDIPSLLARFPDAADVRIPRVEFGFSGHRTRPAGLAIDSYTQVANVLEMDPRLPPRVKTIARPRAISAADIHLAFPADEPGPGQPTRTYEAEVRGVAQLSHYYTRSWEEFEAKRFRGSATGRIARPAVEFDVPTVEHNDAASRFSARTSAMLDYLRSLDPAPYLYGSQLGFSYFPRPNDLFRFAEFALANYAAGLLEPRRYATVRLDNLYEGIGLVADISEREARPARGALSGSHHMAALLEHMRGRVVAGLESDLPLLAMAGSLAVPHEGPAALLPSAGMAELLLALPADDTRRCYSLGFLAACGAPVSVAAVVQRTDGSSGEPVAFELPAGTSLAGVVEVEPVPVHGASLRLQLETAASEVTLFDLFVIANG